MHLLLLKLPRVYLITSNYPLISADNSSYVEAYFEEGDDGQQNLVATIKTKQDVYVIEVSHG